MKKTAKTIQLFLPDGNPRGVKIAEITSRTIQVISVPRAQLDFAIGRPELSNVGTYYLFGDSETGNLPQLYIGEAEDCASRLKQHHKSKDWWTTALVCISKTADFTKAHVKYLEWHAHQVAGEVGRYRIENGNTPPKAHISEPVEADLMDHFATMNVLCATLGYPLFDKLVKSSTRRKDLLFCLGKKAQAKGEYSEDGLTVFSGSIANRNFVRSSHAYLSTYREGLLNDGILEVVDEDTLRFVKDHAFNSPSQAAGIVLARNANGWIEWKFDDGRTLDSLR
ncbi:MAG: GIY-YIG nuclease family protein [Verrucomicrobiales bacterium]